MNLLIVYAAVGAAFAYLALLAWVSDSKRLDLQAIVPTILILLGWPFFLASWIKRIYAHVRRDP